MRPLLISIACSRCTKTREPNVHSLRKSAQCLKGLYPHRTKAGHPKLPTTIRKGVLRDAVWHLKVVADKADSDGWVKEKGVAFEYPKDVNRCATSL